MTRKDIQANRQFKPVPASGSIAVGLGTTEQKSLIFGDYKVVRTVRDDTIDLFNRVLRLPKKVRVRAVDESSHVAVSVTLEQEFLATKEASSSYYITHVEIYVPFDYVSGHEAREEWDDVRRAEEVADRPIPLKPSDEEGGEDKELEAAIMERIGVAVAPIGNQPAQGYIEGADYVLDASTGNYRQYNPQRDAGAVLYRYMHGQLFRHHQAGEEGGPPSTPPPSWTWKGYEHYYANPS